MPSRSVRSYEFETFRLVVGEKQLLNHGKPVLLMPKAFDVLLSLVSRHGHLVEKAELLREVWPDSVVEESNLAQNVHHLRKALGDGHGGRRLIETVPRRGYRFIADVTEVYEDERDDDERRRVTAPAGGAEEATTPARTDGARARRASWAASRAKPLALLAALACACWLLFARGERGVESPGERARPKSVAVLPFEPIGGAGGDGDRLLGLGMADALIGKLSNIRAVPVLPTGSVLRYAGRAPDPLVAGQELGVEAVISGTVQVSGRDMRVGVQLVSVADKRTIWSGTFDDLYDNIFTLQDLISERVASELALQMTPEERKGLAAHQTDHVEAYHAYLMGLSSWSKRSEEGLASAIEHLRRAVGIDPNFGSAHALLADSCILVIYNGYDVLAAAEARALAKASAARALEVGGGLAEVHTAQAAVLRDEGDYDGARRSLERAIALNPTYAPARQRYGLHLAQAGRLSAAVEQMQMAQRADPLSAVYNTSLVCLLNYARRHDEAIRYGRLAVELDPNLYDAHINLGEAYEFRGLHREAAAEFEKARALDPRNPYAAECLGHLYARGGRVRAARRELLALEKAAAQSRAPLYGIALIYAALGQREQAVSSFEKAIVSRAVRLTHVRYDPKLDALRGLPEFRDVLSRHGLQHLLP